MKNRFEIQSFKPGKMLKLAYVCVLNLPRLTGRELSRFAAIQPVGRRSRTLTAAGRIY